LHERDFKAFAGFIKVLMIGGFVECRGYGGGLTALPASKDQITLSEPAVLCQRQTVFRDILIVKPDCIGILQPPKALALGLDSLGDTFLSRARHVYLQRASLRNKVAVQRKPN
jgi:hypothetical protein